MLHTYILTNIHTYTFKYQLQSKLDEVIRGTNIRGVTPLYIVQALDRQRSIKQGLVTALNFSIWRRKGKALISWNNNDE